MNAAGITQSGEDEGALPAQTRVLSAPAASTGSNGPESILKPAFTKAVIGLVVNEIGAEPMNLVLAAGDLNGDGRPDLIISGRNGKMVWLENNGTATPWRQHIIDADVEKLERGGVLCDLTGNGLPDLVNGGDWRSDQVYWWENPGSPDVPWIRRLIARTGKCQIHDIIVGDVTGDGTQSLVFTNQIGGTDIYRVAVPRDPRIAPWPGLETIATGKWESNPFAPGGRQPEEGLAIADVDGDGRPELVCGTHWYKFTKGTWRGYKFASGYITTKVAVGDLDGDGTTEIVLSEGDPCVYGRLSGGKLAWFRPKGDPTALWEEHRLADNLLDPHSLQLGDVFGRGRLDMLVGEVGIDDRPRSRFSRVRARLTGAFHRPISRYWGALPRIFLFENDGHGAFRPHLIDRGTGIHDGCLVDVRGCGVLDIVGKPLHGPEKWNVHVWFNDSLRPRTPTPTGVECRK